MEFSLGRHKLPNDVRPCPTPLQNPGHLGVDTRDHHIKAWIVVNYTDIQTIKRNIQDCLRGGAVAAAAAGILAAYASGGAAGISTAIATFKTAFNACIQAKIGQSLNYEVDWKNEYGDYSGH